MIIVHFVTCFKELTWIVIQGIITWVTIQPMTDWRVTTVPKSTAFCLQHYIFVGDCQIPLAIKMFIEEHGEELMSKGLYKNYLLHISNLFEFGVLPPGGVFTAITQLQQFVSENKLSCHLNWKSQHSRWRETRLPEISSRKDFTGIFTSGATPLVAVKDEKIDVDEWYWVVDERYWVVDQRYWDLQIFIQICTKKQHTI